MPRAGAGGGAAEAVHRQAGRGVADLHGRRPAAPAPHAYCNRSRPEAFTSDSAIDEPLPVLLVMLYQSPSRSPGQNTLPTPSVRNSLLTPRT